MSKKLICYFAHLYKFRKSNKKYKIKKILEERRVEVIDPFIKEFKILRKYNIKEYYESPNRNVAREIWMKDLKQIQDSDMLLAWIPEPSIGTAAEIVIAYRSGKFIQIISPLKHPLFAFVLTHGNQQYETVNDYDKGRRLRW